MERIKEKSLIDCLAYCDLRDLPKEDTKEYIWLKAIVLISKTDASQCYALAMKDENGNVKIVKDFGSVAAIHKIEKIYPFLLLDEKFMPTFETKTKDERITWLQRMGEKDDLSQMNMKELNKKVLNVAMQNALRALNKK